MNSNFKEAVAYCLNLLSKRDYTESELIRKVKQKVENIDEEEVLTYLKENNFISDYRVSYNYTLSKMEKGWGKRKIKTYLKQKGVAEETVTRIFKEIDFEYSHIKKEIAKKFPEKPSKKEKEKLIRFLRQRGFSFTEIHNIINGKI